MAPLPRWRRSEDATIDILFGDIVLPGGICGLDVAQQAKQRRPSIRILLASGNALDSLASRGRLGPGAAVLHKPSRTADLVRALLQVLADKRRRPENPNGEAAASLARASRSLDRALLVLTRSATLTFG